MTHLGETVKARNLRATVTASLPTSDGSPGGASAADILSDFLSGLGDIDASILMMYMDGLTAEEMSEVLGITANTIHVRINRMKHKFSNDYVE